MTNRLIHQKHYAHSKNINLIEAVELNQLHENLTVDYAIMGLSLIFKNKDFSVFGYNLKDNFRHFLKFSFYLKIWEKIRRLKK